MPQQRRSILFPDSLWERLQAKSEQENWPISEIIRRACAAYLAWDDPTYAPHPTAQKERFSSPA